MSYIGEESLKFNIMALN